jgi:UDP-N-acetylglucosamine 2-epimerase (non-hydrolysing)
VHIVGARPNFVKAAPVFHAIKKQDVLNQAIIHTGQHYSKNLSESFFQELEIPKPDVNLNIRSGTHGEQTGSAIIELEKVFVDIKPDFVLVYGDVNSTLAATIAAAKLHIPIGHVESGLRSFDKKMPEEINRVAVDHMCDYRFVTEQSGVKNLQKEGIDKNTVFFVGNTMIDSLVKRLPSIPKLNKKDFVLMTFHRPSNVDNPAGLENIYEICKRISSNIIFPVHPRTKNSFKKFGLYDLLISIENLEIVEPMPYDTFLSHMKNAKAVITDSGGIQEETTFLGVPCLTMRKNTERPSTITVGSNVLVEDIEQIVSCMNKINRSEFKSCMIPELWDGNSGKRIAKILSDILLRK